MPELESIRPEHAVRVLLEETDPVRRSRAHLMLGRRALDRADFVHARDHLESAIDLDPTDERPRVALKAIRVEEAPSRGLLALFGFLKRE
ncbi:MAG: Tfp pilus assembly protein PilF [Myxococcota bacterium]|jgi:Tfp pilus assembly protein PilF